MTPRKKKRPVRVSPSPFLRGASWWARIPQLEGKAIQRPLGVFGAANRDVAVEVCRFVAWLKGRRDAFLLEQIATGKVVAGMAYTAHVENRLEGFVLDLKEGVRDVDLEPFVARWQQELARRKKPNPGTRAKYLRQVRTFIPEAKPFRRSTFTKQRIREWLTGLGIEQPNRYRAALSSFAAFLMFEDVIPSNPVLQVPAAAESEPRTKYLVQLDAKKLIAAFEDPLMRAFHATMMSMGMEFGAAKVIDPATVTDTSVYAAGTKKPHRRRTCELSPRWKWAWDIARAEIVKAADGSQPFASIDVHASHRALKAALKAAQLDPDYTQHDHRHTWAVQAVRDGLPLHVIAHQLGHRDPVMTLRVYGRFRPSGADYVPKKAPNATVSATAPDHAEELAND